MDDLERDLVQNILTVMNTSEVKCKEVDYTYATTKTMKFKYGFGRHVTVCKTKNTVSVYIWNGFLFPTGMEIDPKELLPHFENRLDEEFDKLEKKENETDKNRKIQFMKDFL